MKVKTSKETVEKLILLLETWDSSTEQFLNELPTPEKYAILAMAMTVRCFDDFEEAYYEATHKISAQELTKGILDYPDLKHHLQDALSFKWSYFEVIWADDKGDGEKEA